MPFKLKLKKSRQYNVSSKNLFVLSVELLDNTTVECTLSSQSLGQECLNNVCQRLGLQQPQYFGLRFLSKKGTFWWVDLQRSLKKQLDKYALESCNLSLGVMYFVSDVNLLHDEVTRYHYFLQLKVDILDGRLHCNEEQIILFASYSLQAEFGDHDPERHTTEYLTNFGLLPKQMIQGKENQEAILERVILTHRSLQGMSQQLAEVCYIMEAQRLTGYGLECFAGKDNCSNSLIVGVSLLGIYIWYLNNMPSVYLPWHQILNLVHHKRCFGIEYRNSSKVLQTFMEDSHLAKYVWKMCIQQHRFYTKNETLVSNLNTDFEDPRKNIPVSTTSSRPHLAVQNDHTSTRSHFHQQESQESLDGLGVYHTDSGYSEIVSSSNALMPEDPKLELSSSSSSFATVKQSPLNSNPTCINISESKLPPACSQCLSVAKSSVIYTKGSQFRQTSSSLSINQQNPWNVQNTSVLDMKPICSVLPMYRQAPDYDTAVKIKYGLQSCSTNDVSSNNPLPSSKIVTRSQVDVSNIYPEQSVHSYSHYKNYADLSCLSTKFGKDANSHEANVLVRSQEHISVPSLHPPVHTYSSPDLASQAKVDDYSLDHIANAHLLYQFKPPPPYPYKQRSSSSTPDLTRNYQAQLPVSSPTVLSKNLGLTENCVPQPSAATFQVLSPCSPHFKIQRNMTGTNLPQSHESSFFTCAKLVTSTVVPHQTIASSQKVGIENSLPAHTYQNYNPPVISTIDKSVSHLNEPIPQLSLTQSQEMLLNPQYHSQMQIASAVCSQNEPSTEKKVNLNDETHSMGPMLMAAMNGLSLSRPDILMQPDEEKTILKDARIQCLEDRLCEGRLFLEFECILKKKPNADFSTALLVENVMRNRFKDVFPYEENRVHLTPTSENKMGYINASHLNVSIGGTQRFYIAAQGPLPNTLYSFWQMIWEHNVSVIVMLTEIQEEGREKCFPYWPQEDGNKLQIGEFQISRNFSLSSPTYVTCSLSLCHITSQQQKSVWHIQYNDWPDHSCPQDVQGFIAFMNEVDAVRRHAISSQTDGNVATSPIVVHCSAGVGRSGAVILCDIMLYALDHNQPIDLPKMLTHLRLQRMLIVQTLAQYKFVYTVLIQYLKNSRLI